MNDIIHGGGDIMEGVYRSIKLKPQSDSYQIMNIGDGAPVNLLQIIETLENALGQKVQKLLTDASWGRKRNLDGYQ